MASQSKNASARAGTHAQKDGQVKNILPLVAIWKEVVREDCQARKLNKEDAMDRCKWRKMIKEAR